MNQNLNVTKKRLPHAVSSKKWLAIGNHEKKKREEHSRKGKKSQGKKREKV